MTGSTIFITGAHGFLGRHIVSAAQTRGYRTLTPPRAELDLCDRSAVLRFVATQKPDAIIHAAATGGGIGWMKEHPETALLGNVLASTHTLEAAAEHKIPLVGVSSACVYPRVCPQPMREDDIYQGEPEPTNGPYGHAKRLMMVQGQAAHQERGLECSFLVPTNLYGPYDHFAPTRSHIVAALLSRFLDATRQNAPVVTCWGTGTATRDLLYAPDCAEAILTALERKPGPEPINLGTGVEHTTRTIAEACAHACGYPGRIDWDTTRPDGMPRKVLDTTRAQQKLGWTAKTSLEDGLQETLAWYLRDSHY